MIRRAGTGRPPLVADADEAFVRSLWDDHAGALLAYATRITGDRGRAEDIVQEAMLRAWRHAGDLDTGDGRSLRPWLFTVVAHLATDWRRARRARPTEVSDQALASWPAGDELDRAVESWGVADRLRALSAEHRAVLIETYYLGHSVSEAAAALGIPAGTVKSRCYYALRTLRRTLREPGLDAQGPREQGPREEGPEEEALREQGLREQAVEEQGRREEGPTP